MERPAVDDLTELMELNEDTIFGALEARFYAQRIYTNTGHILLAVNPFERLPGLYGSERMETYASYYAPDDNRNDDGRAAPAPHIYRVAATAYQAMMRGKLSDAPSDQSILISGESGSGKTESTKLLMEYLAHVGDVPAPVRMSMPVNTSTISDKVLDANIVLESFGNARTLRNDNSSRFGKLIQMNFDHGLLTSASIQTYLLEKVRLVTQSKGERNYHIFYEMLMGSSEVQLASWRLIASPEMRLSVDARRQLMANFRYLNQTDCYDRKDHANDAHNYNQMLRALQMIGFSAHEQLGMQALLAAVLHLGNLTFQVAPKDHCHVAPSSQAALAAAATLLSLRDAGALEKALVTRTFRVAAETKVLRLSVDEAKNTRDGLTKALYGRLFEWLVGRMNAFLRHDDRASDNASSFGTSTSHAASSWIGILDIFGFEVFPLNSFEQLCINFANETLQQQFNLHNFANEQVEYKKEGLAWDYVAFTDNKECVDLFSAKPFGLFSLMDEESMLAKGTDASLASKLYARCGSHVRFSASRVQQGRGLFSIDHYAGLVEYTTVGIREKNKDELRQDIVDLFQTATAESSFARLLCEAGLTHRRSSHATLRRQESKRLNTASVGGQFKTQLLHLMEMLKLTAPHYVRCIKPNDEAAARVMTKDRVAEQLRCNGVLQAVQVARAGFPIRMLHAEFIGRYTVVARASARHANLSSLYAVIDHCLPHLPLASPPAGLDLTALSYARGLQIGVTKVFLRAASFERLERLRVKYVAAHHLYIAQRLLGYLHRRRYLRFRHAVLVLQNRFRRRRARHRAATILQALGRKVLAKTHFDRLKRSVIYLQRRVRAKQQRQQHRRTPLRLELEGSDDDDDDDEDAWLANVPRESYSALSPISSSDDDEDVVRMTYVAAPLHQTARSSGIYRSTVKQLQPIRKGPAPIAELSPRVHPPPHPVSPPDGRHTTSSSGSRRTTMRRTTFALRKLSVLETAKWKQDQDSFACYQCNKRFTLFRRRHHCRVCGEVICDSCSTFVGLEKQQNVRVCVLCSTLNVEERAPTNITVMSDDVWPHAWPEPPYPHDEDARLLIVRQLPLQTMMEAREWLGLCNAVQAHFRASVAYISIICEEDQWVISRVGSFHTKLPREMSFCSYTICGGSPLVVKDATLDARFKESPLVQGGKGKFRFYAGAPIVWTVETHIVFGTIAVLDTKPRKVVTPEDVDFMATLSAAVSARMSEYLPHSVK